jgi:ABC-type uncharacterized transport system permease subunit
MPRVARLGWSLAAVTLGIALLAGGLELMGYDAGSALAALWSGAFGSWYAFSSATLVRSVPLILTGLGIAIARRGGALNIGAEGQFYAGAIAAAWVALHGPQWPAPVAITGVLLASALAGSLWVVVPVLLKLRFGVIEVISTLLLVFVAELLVSLMVEGPLQEQSHIFPQSDAIPQPLRLPVFGGTRLHAGFPLALIAGAALWWVFSRTWWGFKLRAAGLGPRAAEVSGRIDSRKVAAGALLLSGAFAGLAGGIEVAGVSYALYANLSPGYGFSAIAVALLAGLHPLGVIATGIMFGALEAGAGAMQRDAGVPAVAVYVVEAVIMIVALLATTPRRGWTDALVMRRRRFATRRAA